MVSRNLRVHARQRRISYANLSKIVDANKSLTDEAIVKLLDEFKAERKKAKETKNEESDNSK